MNVGPGTDKQTKRGREGGGGEGRGTEGLREREREVGWVDVARVKCKVVNTSQPTA